MSKLVALDIGFGQTKAYDGTNAVCFRSVWSKPDAASLNRARHGEHVIEDETGQPWMIGDAALRYSDNPSVPFVDSDFVREPAYKMLALKALRELGHDRVEIVAGLPVRHMRQLVKRMPALIEGWSYEHNPSFVLPDGSPIQVRAKKIVPQPLGTLMEAVTNESGELTEDMSKNRSLIVDVGDGTIDVIEMTFGEVNLERQACFNYGASQMYFDIYCHLVSKLKMTDIRRAYIPKIVEQGWVEDKGRQVPITKVIEDAKAKLAQAVDVTIREKWGDARNISKIILTGGGANLVAKYMKKNFSERQLTIPVDPSLANARGYYKLGLRA